MHQDSALPSDLNLQIGSVQRVSGLIRRHCVLAALAIAAMSLGGGTHAAFAADKVCKLEISGNDAMQYDKKELDVAADCTLVSNVTLTHTGKLPAAAMGHVTGCW